MYIGWDITYLLVILGAIICSVASARVNSTFKKYSRYGSLRNITGAMAAQEILNSNGIYDVDIVRVSGSLTDHYDPSKKTLALSGAVYDSTSVSAISVAAHECGHAIQHEKGYLPLLVRSALVPFANFGAKLAWPVIIIGALINNRSSMMIINIGILLFCAAVAFQIVTLPVEFNASRRALEILTSQRILVEYETKYARKVLTAAALTYVASVAAILLQLLRIFLLFGGGRRRD